MWPPWFLLRNAFKAQPGSFQLCHLFLLCIPLKSARSESLRPFSCLFSAGAQRLACVWPSIVPGRCLSFSAFLFLKVSFPSLSKILVSLFFCPLSCLSIIPGSKDYCSTFACKCFLQMLLGSCFSIGRVLN